MASGARSAKITEFLKLGANGKHSSNIERDLHALARKFFGTPDLIYRAKCLVRKQGSELAQEKTLHFILPHELFCVLHDLYPEKWRQVFGLNFQPEYWANMMKATSEWLDRHPLRLTITETTFQAVAYRIFGDETGLNKGADRPVTIVEWTAEGCELPPWLSRLPILVMPEHWALPGITIQMAHEVIKWSCNCLAIGKYPHYDHAGQTFPRGSWRGTKAGQNLTADGHYGILSATVADWKWAADNYDFEQKYSKDELCQRCCVTKQPGRLDYARFDPCCPRRSHDSYIGSTEAKNAPLSGILGWHLSIVMPEIVHGGPLGQIQSLDGSLLKDLADSGIWGDGGAGKWEVRLKTQLSIGYDEFRAWSAAEKKGHSQPRFTPLKLSLKSKKSFAVLKCKAHNSLVVLEWLATLVSKHNGGSNYHDIRECVTWAWNKFFRR